MQSRIFGHLGVTLALCGCGAAQDTEPSADATQTGGTMGAGASTAVGGSPTTGGTASTMTCPVGQTPCGSLCVDLGSSTENCGQCSIACTGTLTCVNGICTESSVGSSGGSDAAGARPGTGGGPKATGGADGSTENSGGAPSFGGTEASTGSAASSSEGGAAGETPAGGASAGETSAGGTSSTAGDGWLVSGTCHPLCTDGSADPDGDGWGWENEASCVVVGSDPYSQGTACGNDAASGGTNPGTGGTQPGTGGGLQGTGGSSETTSCGVTPVTPNATQQAQNLLCYLYSIYGSKVLSGQQETSWSNPEGDISWYVSNVGKSPAVLGGDYLYPDGTSDRAIAYWKAGGISMIRYHMGAPPNSDTYENSKGSANIDNVLRSGTAENQSFNSKLDYVATELKKLADADVAVLWAPFHEYQPNGWFWWSKGSASQFKQLWDYMFDYLTATKGLDNLVWLAPSSGTLDAAWFPGNEHVDIAGPDTYATDPPFSQMYSQAKAIVGSTMPIPLHETGVVPQPSTMFPSAAPWVLWSIWAGYQTSHNSLGDIQSAYSSDYTLTRDEVPNLK